MHLCLHLLLAAEISSDVQYTVVEVDFSLTLQVTFFVTLLTVKILPDKLHPSPLTVAPEVVWPLEADIVNVAEFPSLTEVLEGFDVPPETTVFTV